MNTLVSFSIIYMEKLRHREKKGHRGRHQGFICKECNLCTKATLCSIIFHLKGPQMTCLLLLLDFLIFNLCYLKLIFLEFKRKATKKSPLPHFPLCLPLGTSAFVFLSSPQHLTTTKEAAELPSHVNRGKYQAVWNPRSY